MALRLVVSDLKKRIKDLSVKQRPLKQARKTLLELGQRRALLERSGMGPETTPGDAAWEVLKRRAMITACLNLVHEVCGSEYRHGPGEKWLYEKYDRELRKEFLVEKV